MYRQKAIKEKTVMDNKMNPASQPQHKMIIEENVMVSARDGVKLAVDVYRPDGPGKFPGLLAISVYGKSTQTFETPPQPFGGNVYEASIESGVPEYWASRGYALVIADYRGTGDSEGELPGMFSKYEGEDGYDIVEWMARQPWCSGKIGGCGICYFGFAQILIAELQPPHLTCIAPWEINLDDFYKHGFYAGGVHHLVWYGLVSGSHPARIGYASKNVVSAMEKMLSAEKLQERVKKAMADPDLRQYPYIWQILKYPYKNPIVFDALLNPLDGPFWQERSYCNKLDKINVPTYIGGPFQGPFGTAQTAVYNKLANTEHKKLNLYTDMDPRPWKTNHDELLRWYDYWLKGIDTGIMDEPPVRIHAKGLSQDILTDSWPTSGMNMKPLYLGSLGRLMSQPDLYNDEPDAFVQQPLFVTNQRARATYISDPMSQDTLVMGSPIVKFYASIDQKDTCWRVDIWEEGVDTQVSLAQGWLRASLRKRLPEKDTPWEIEHDFTQFDYPAADKVYEYEIQLRPLAHLFRVGSRIRFEISCIDVPLEAECYDNMWHMCKCQTCLHKIFRDAKHPSVLMLPVAENN
jgi:putative CocE/NonD family hydrolase